MARSYLAGLAALCIALRDRAHAPQLYERVAARPEAWSVDAGQTMGPWALLLGGLARLGERPAEAAQHFETAIHLGQRMGARPVVARAQSLLVSVRLAQHPAAAEQAHLAALLAEAAQAAQELGLRDVTARVARLQAALGRPPAPGAPTFRRDGDVWTVGYGGRDLRLKDGKGPRYLATLLAAPGREVHVLELAAAVPAGLPAGATTGLPTGHPGGALDDAPDAHARRAYRARLTDLRAELDEAEQHRDSGRAERVRAELDLLVSQLAQRCGSHVRTRSGAETARKAVTKVLRMHIGKLLRAYPSLGEHLRESVRMGTFCTYAPRKPTTWEVAWRG
jgi:hypothetical protein